MIQLSSTSSACTHAESVVARLPNTVVSDYVSTLENGENFQSCDRSALFMERRLKESTLSTMLRSKRPGHMETPETSLLDLTLRLSFLQ